MLSEQVGSSYPGKTFVLEPIGLGEIAEIKDRLETAIREGSKRNLRTELGFARKVLLDQIQSLDLLESASEEEIVDRIGRIRNLANGRLVNGGMKGAAEAILSADPRASALLNPILHLSGVDNWTMALTVVSVLKEFPDCSVKASFGE